jgi:predicted nucleic acid-binding Zn ribbon protein
MQKISEAPLKRCPSCRKRVIKLISNSSFHLKGSGWYVTDYARKGSKKEEKPEAKDSSEAKTKTEKKAKSSEKPKAKSGSTESAAA